MSSYSTLILRGSGVALLAHPGEGHARDCKVLRGTFEGLIAFPDALARESEGVLWYNMKPNQQLLDNVSMNVISIMILKHQLSMFEDVELWNGCLLLIQLTGLFPARILQN